MTVICGGGTSGPKPAAAAVVDYSAGLLAAIFAAYDLAWLIPIIPFVGLAPLTLSTFCSGDPPAVPVFTSAETNAILELKFGSDFDSGLGKLKDLVLNTIWYDACQCTSGALTPLTPPAMPAGTPVFQPPVAPKVTPCKSSGPNMMSQGGGSFSFRALIDLRFLVPTSVRITVTQSIVTGTGCSTNYQIHFHDSTGTNIPAGESNYTVPAATSSFTTIVGVPPGAVECYANVTYNGPFVENSGIKLEAFCNGDPPGGSELPCCPPDVATQASLDLILKMVTLIQRQSVPFAYLSSTAHPALAGAGSIAIQGLLGVKVEVTTLPASLGVSGTTPAEHFDLGFLTFGTPDGYPQSIRLEHQVQLMLPARCSVFTTLAYDLHPGVVVTVTELLREP